MRRARTLVRRACGHVSPVVVNAVEGGGYRAHCLACGMVGPVLKTREAARLALSARANDARKGAGG